MTDQTSSILAECCDVTAIHYDVVEAVLNDMPRDHRLQDLAELFKVFGDPTRVRILWALEHAELCVCDIAIILDMTQSAISHQLRTLKQAKLVKSRREGRVVYYSLADDHIHQIFAQGLEHVLEED